MTLMSFRSTPVAVAGSMTRMTASTLIGASRLEYSDTTLEHSEVVALLSSVSRSLSCTGRLMAVSTSTPLSTAFWKDSEMMVGWMPGYRDNGGTLVISQVNNSNREEKEFFNTTKFLTKSLNPFHEIICIHKHANLIVSPFNMILK